jgi:hypothetical protein
METTDRFSSDAKTLTENYNEALKLIKETVEKKNWRLKGELKEKLVVDFVNSTKTSRKGFRDRINKVLKNPTIKSINELSWGIEVKISEKEEQIQLKRKAWKIAQREAERLLLEYKIEKGDFYKKQMGC